MKKLALLALLVACGGSSAQLKTARDARYSAPEATLLSEVKGVVEKNYQIVLEDPATRTIKTRPVWHRPEGPIDQAPGNNPARLNEGSINLSFIVSIPQVDGAYRVNIEPIILRKEAISSAPQPLTLDNALVPGWVHGKLEALELALHDRLKSYAASGAPAPRPAEPAPMPPAAEQDAGSAAGSAVESSPPSAP